MSGESRIRVPWAVLSKDFRLLWPLVAGSAMLQGLLGVIQHHASPFDFGPARQAVAALVTLVLAVSLVVVIAITVQQDPLPGANQDWVVRPIGRRDLLVAKLLAVVLFIHGPIFTVQVLQGLSEGFGLSRILPAALLSNAEIALVFTLPVTAIAAVSRSVGEGILVSLGAFAGLILILVLFGVFHYLATGSWRYTQPVAGTGVEWVWGALSHVALLSSTVAVLLLQYGRRRTLDSRVVFIGGLLAFVFVPWLPWRPAFALQEWLGPRGSDAPISIAFSTTPHSASGGVPAATPEVLGGHAHNEVKDGGIVSGSSPEDLVRIVVPLTVSDLPAGSILHGDRARVWLSDAHGTVYRGVGRVFDLRAPRGGGEAVLGQAIDIPLLIYRRWAGEPLQLRIRYSLTLLRERTLGTLPVPGRADLPGLGRCADRVDSHRRLVVACMTVGAEPPCVAIRLDPTSGAAQGPETFRCKPDYAPAALRFTVNPIVRFQRRLPPTAAAASMASYKGGSPLAGAHLRFASYEPQAHFSRRVRLEGLHLTEWRTTAPQAPRPAPGKGSGQLLVPGG